MFGLDFTQLGIIGALVAAIGGMIWKLLASTKRAGIDQEKARQADAWNQTQTRVEQAVAPVSRLDDTAVRDELRQRASTPSPRNPV